MGHKFTYYHRFSRTFLLRVEHCSAELSKNWMVLNRFVERIIWLFLTKYFRPKLSYSFSGIIIDIIDITDITDFILFIY